jgi:hypothetical protein
LREAGGVFMLPAYLFLFCMFLAIGLGVVKSFLAAGHPVPVVPPPPAPPATEAVGLWLLLKAFSSGCTAMTGIEAVSNGVKAFREPAIKNARLTLTIIIASLTTMLAGIAFLARAYGIAATHPDSEHYQSVLSLLLQAVAGRGWFYYLAIGSILLVLIFSANTAFAGFPRVCRVIANDYSLPLSFANRGRRLVYSEGVVVLAILTAMLLIFFDGVTDRLIPLYRCSGLCTPCGATMTVCAARLRVLRRSTCTTFPLPWSSFPRPYWSRVTKDALCAAFEISENIQVLHVTEEEKAEGDEFCDKWDELVARPAGHANLRVPELVRLVTPFRFVVSRIVDYIIQLAESHPDRRIVTIVPELVERRWYAYFLP